MAYQSCFRNSAFERLLARARLLTSLWDSATNLFVVVVLREAQHEAALPHVHVPDEQDLEQNGAEFLSAAAQLGDRRTHRGKSKKEGKAAGYGDRRSAAPSVTSPTLVPRRFPNLGQLTRSRFARLSPSAAPRRSLLRPLRYSLSCLKPKVPRSPRLGTGANLQVSRRKLRFAVYRLYTMDENAVVSTTQATAAPEKKGPTLGKSGKKICCSCPETRRVRDECVVMNGESACSELIEAHKVCLRHEGFQV
eukprot:scaffold7060_cov280-Pinguiococcus_pyrenoidosus.AAC.2